MTMHQLLVVLSIRFAVDKTIMAEEINMTPLCKNALTRRADNERYLRLYACILLLN